MRPLFFDADGRSDGDAEDARGRQGHPAGQRQQPVLAACRWPTSRASPRRYGLNSRLVKQNGKLVEEVYKVGGKYDAQIRAIIGHLEAAQAFATPTMKEALAKLVQWYRTGEDADRKAYDIAWVADKNSPVDTINGFIEVYLDAARREGLVGGARLLREPPEDGGHREAGDQRAVVRGPHAVGARVPQGRREGHHRQGHRRRDRDRRLRARSRRSASTCPTIRRCARSTAASRCRSSNVTEAYDKCDGAGVPPASSPGRPRK